VTDGWAGDIVSAVGSGGIGTTTLETKGGKKVLAADALCGKVVALFFSAHWCPGCRDFTPVLAKAYTDAKAAGKNIEIVFVSSDVDAASQAKYMNEDHGDWLRVPFEDPLREALKKQYGSFAGKEAAGFADVKRREGIPNLVVVGPNGEEHVFEEGEGSLAIEKQGAAAFDAWSVFAWPLERKRSASSII
jgi:thiol-disulfide isomerase/thioredoxin